MKFGLLGSNILFSSCDSLHYDFLGAQTEVSQLDKGERFANKILWFQQNILRFQVSVGDSMIMKFLDSLADL